MTYYYDGKGSTLWWSYVYTGFAFSFSGIMVALCIIFKNPMLVGSIATEGTAWYSIWSVVESGAWTVFNQMELLFVIGLPIGLAKKASARAVMEAFVVYITCNYFISTMLGFYSGFFSVDFSADRAVRVD